MFCQGMLLTEHWIPWEDGAIKTEEPYENIIVFGQDFHYTLYALRIQKGYL